ncbi:MAG: nickel-dependent lactate racemase [Anaerolineae bacterium]
MRVRLAYGKTGLEVDLPESNVTVLEPRYVPGLPKEDDALRAALRAPIGCAPLRELVSAEDTVAIVFSDITRPQPRERMLPVLLEELAYVPRERIVLITGLGTHRPNTPSELEAMLGRDIVQKYRVVQHNACDGERLLPVGRTRRGHEVRLNADYLRASVRILTGFIEPHLFAGFSGGPKAVLPGIAAQEAVLANHDAQMIAHPSATWGVTEGNPVWEEMREVALLSRPTFLYNVALNREQAITGVFAGEMLAAHAAGTCFVGTTALVPVREPFDIVLTSNAGYPLDLNLYQTVKGMAAAAQVVRPGGAIIVAAECWDGIPDHGAYGRILQSAKTPRALLERISACQGVEQDQWQAQIQAQIQCRAEVHVYSRALSDEALRRALLIPCASVEETLRALLLRYGPRARIGVLPEGPMTVPYVA